MPAILECGDSSPLSLRREATFLPDHGDCKFAVTAKTRQIQRSYEAAITLLTDLRDVAARRGRIDEAQQRIEQYRERFARRQSIMRRFRDAGL